MGYLFKAVFKHPSVWTWFRSSSRVAACLRVVKMNQSINSHPNLSPTYNISANPVDI